MSWVAGPDLVSAVSNAGGLGVLGEAAGPESYADRRYTIAGLRTAIRQVKDMTDRPFGVGNVSQADWMAMVAEERVPIVLTAEGHPGPSTAFYKDQGIKVIHMGSSVRHARLSEAAGVDAFALAGFEGGGHSHGGHDLITTFAGIPQVVDAVQIPVVAAGGIADGRGLVAALALGAQGVRIGTRFAATVEAANHLNHKQAIVDAIDTGTIYRGARWGDVLRSLKTPYVVGLEELESSGATLEDIARFIGGSSPAEGTLARQLLGEVDGDLLHGEVHAGQIAGLIREIEPAALVVRKIVDQALELVEGFGHRIDGT